MITMINMKVLIGFCFLAVAFAIPEVKKTCLEKPDPGMCFAAFRMWYYDPETESCHKFIYGGCLGNGNRYRTEEECLDNCKGVEPVPEQFSDDICDLPAVRGLCFASLRRFYFDKTSGQCKQFIYGGCNGNENNFKTFEECKRTCNKQALSQDVDCNAFPEAGLCDAYMPRYYYNPLEGRCKRFIYGGCGGNTNNFQTEEECNSKCGDSEDVEFASLPFSCACENGNSTCSCCGNLFVPAIRLDQKACVEVGYNGEKSALKVTIRMNDKIVFSQTISAKNPPPVCVGPGHASLFADVCFDFYDIKVSLEKVHFCLNVKPRLLRKEVTDIKVGCVNFNRKDEESQ